MTRRRQTVAAALTGPSSPLAAVSRANFDRIELNMQIMRIPAAEKKDFGTHAEYLLKVFNFDLQTQQFVETKLENQLDRYLGLCPRERQKGRAGGSGADRPLPGSLSCRIRVSSRGWPSSRNSCSASAAFMISTRARSSSLRGS